MNIKGVFMDSTTESKNTQLIHQASRLSLWLFILCSVVLTVVAIIGVWVSTQTRVETNLETTFGFTAVLTFWVSVLIRIVEGKRK
jgi:zinc transporter ZupT